MMDHSYILIDIQKELLQILLTDHTLKERFLNIVQKNNNIEPENSFVGYIIHKKTGVKGDLGFPVKKLEKWAYDNKCGMNILSNFKPQYVLSYEYILQKDTIHVSLHKNSILDILRKPIWGRNLDHEKNSQEEKTDFKVVIECHLNGQNNSVVNLRTLFYAFFLKRFLFYSQKSESCILCQIRTSDGNHGKQESNHMLSLEDISYIESELSLKDINMISIDGQVGNCSQVIADLKDRFPQCVIEDSECLEIDGKQLVQEGITNKDIYSKDIGFIKVLDQGNPTSNLKDAAVLNGVLKGKVTHVVHIVSSQRLHHVQKSALILHASSDINPQTFCVFAENPDSLMNSFLITRTEELFASYQSKYGSTVTGTLWEEKIKQVAVSSLVLDIFSLSLNNKLKIVSVENISCLSSRKSMFILYNYARLHKLQEQFEEKVKEGVYEPLPSIENVSFSLLTEESEWNLVIQYILMYPTLLCHIYSSFKGQVGQVNLPVYQVCKFLCDLCHDFSSYYHQTKVLLDPQPHLSQLISARLYLILTLKDIMSHCFMLLGITPPEQM